MVKVSVCMAVHNGEQYLKEQIDSILFQLGDNDELIISDDGSTDTTISIIEAYFDKRLKLVLCKTPNNPIKNFENALLNCSGDIIFLSDQDDLWRENKINIMIEELERYDLVLCDCIVVDEKLTPLQNSFFDKQKTRLGLLNNIWKNGYVGCCMAFKRPVLEKALPFPGNIPMHDQWIGLVGSLFFKSTVKREQLVYYRRHQGNTTMTGSKSKYNILEKVLFRLNLIKNLIKLYI